MTQLPFQNQNGEQCSCEDLHLISSLKLKLRLYNKVL